MLILGLVQAVMAIVASGFSCAAVCCRKNSKFHGTVIFAPSTNTNGQTYAPAPVALNGQTATQSEGKYLQVFYIYNIKMTENLKYFFAKYHLDCPPSYQETSVGNYEKLFDCA